MGLTKSKVFAFLKTAVATVVIACVPQREDVRTIQRPVPATSPTSAQVIPRTPEIQPTIANPQTGCKQGSEKAIPELRSCCKENNWGKSCDGECWEAGVGEKLKRLCSPSSKPVNDCSQSPDKAKKTEWCAFHYNRRYCGISDSDWTAYCKSNSAPTSNQQK